MPTHPPSSLTLRNSLKALRTLRGMTQEYLAARTGVTRQTIINIEQERSAPSIFLAYRIAAVLNVPVTTIFTVIPENASAASGVPYATL